MSETARTAGTAGNGVQVGLMLYTVKDLVEHDLPGTLERVAALGFDGVEIWRLHGRDAVEVRKLLDDLGLAVSSRHVSLAELETGLPQVAAECEALGTTRIVLGYMQPPKSVAEAAANAERLAGLARSAAALGLELGYHNHGDELRPLEDGRSFLDFLLDDEELFLELDLGWAWHVGADSEALLRRARGRCPLIHAKDFVSRENFHFCAVGEGGVGYERMLPLAVAAGAEWLIVEQDAAPAEPMMEAVARSAGTVRSIVAEMQ